MSNVTPLSVPPSCNNLFALSCQQVTLASVAIITSIALSVLVHPAFLVGAVGIASFALYKAYTANLKNLDLWPNRYDPLFRKIFNGTPYDFDKLPIHPTILKKNLEPSELKDPITRCVYADASLAVHIKVTSELGEQSFVSLVGRTGGLYIYGLNNLFTLESISQVNKIAELEFGHDILDHRIEFDKIAIRTGGQECSRILREDVDTQENLEYLKRLLDGKKLTVPSLHKPVRWSISLS